MSRKKRVNRSSKLDYIPGLDYEEVKENIGIWIEHFLSRNNPVFNNLPPCPFAKKAWTEDKVEVILCPQPKNLGREKNLLDHNKDVLVYVLDRVIVQPYMLTQIVENFNRENPDLIALDDHPEQEEVVDGVRLNHGTYALALVQKRDKLNKFREILAKQGYYNNWDDNYLQEVLNT